MTGQTQNSPDRAGWDEADRDRDGVTRRENRRSRPGRPPWREPKFVPQRTSSLIMRALDSRLRGNDGANAKLTRPGRMGRSGSRPRWRDATRKPSFPTWPAALAGTQV